VIRAVTFDAVGTLFVPSPSVGAIYAEVAAGFGVHRDAAALEAAFLPAFKHVQSTWHVPYGADESDARRFWHAVIDATFAEPMPEALTVALFDTFATAARWRILPGVRDALTMVGERNIPMAVVSNFDRRLPPLLSDLYLGPFSAVITSAAVGRAKPDPTSLLTACRLLDVAASEVLHLGDSEREDGGMCQAVGARWLRCDGGIPLDQLDGILRAATT
jgi:putative hydrolase of the HAD superfamily